MKNCLICKEKHFELIYNNTLQKCLACGFITANLEIDTLKLEEIYNENYFKGEEYLDYCNDKNIIQKNFQNRLDYIFKKVNKSSIQSALELGSAYGFFAETINNNINNLNYTGIDIEEKAVNYGQNILKQNLIQGNYLELKLNNNYTDVFMWDVIEHLAKPAEFINKISQEIIIGGHLYITTGDIDSELAKRQKEKWRLIHPPTHLHYFSKKTITQLLEQNNFTIEDISYPAIKRSLKQIFYSLFILGQKPPEFIKFLYNLISPNWSKSVNTHDIMFIIARKK